MKKKSIPGKPTVVPPVPPEEEDHSVIEGICANCRKKVYAVRPDAGRPYNLSVRDSPDGFEHRCPWTFCGTCGVKLGSKMDSLGRFYDTDYTTNKRHCCDPKRASKHRPDRLTNDWMYKWHPLVHVYSDRGNSEDDALNYAVGGFGVKDSRYRRK